MTLKIGLTTENSFSLEFPSKLTIYNCTSVKEQSYEKFFEIGDTLSKQVFFKFMVWMPNMTLTSCKYYAYLNSMLFQVLPALLLDGFMMLTKRKPM